MFRKKTVPVPVQADLSPYEKRANELDIKQKEAIGKLNLMTLNWDSNVGNYKRRLKGLKNELDEIETKIKEMKRTFVSMARHFSDIAMQDDLDKVKKLIDAQNYTELMPRKEFKKLIRLD